MRSIAVIGLGGFGSTVAKELSAHGVQVLAIDEQKERVEAIKDSVAYAVTLDSTDRSALASVSIQEVDVAVVCIGEDVEANLLTTILLKKMGVKKVWGRAINELQQEILRSIDVDEIVSLEEQMGKAIARSLASANVSKHTPIAEGQSLAEVKMPESFVGKTLKEIDPGEKYGVNVVAIKTLIPSISDSGEREFEESVDVVMAPEAKLDEDQVLLVAGPDRNIEKLAKG